MKRPLTFISALALAAALPGTAFAQSAIETFIGHVEPGADGGAQLDIRLLNTGTATAEASLPDAVEARLARPGALGAGRTVMLQRSPATPATMAIAPGSFASAHYQLAPGSVQDGALLSVPLWGGQAVTLAAASPVPPAAPSGAAPNPDVQVADALPATPPPSDRTVGNAFLENLSAYDPIYAVYGPGTNSEARIQLSFKYQLFGSRAREGRPALGDGFYFAYTQRMFWDLGADSSPFRNIDFQPELFYVTPPKALSDKTTLSAQIGMRHESNGRDGDFSRSLNTVYIAPMAAFSLGGGTRLTVAPRAWFYAGDLSDNPDIRRYRGNTGLFVEIGQENGLRLSTSSRFNFGSGKGSIAADLSYPLRRILGGGPDFYLFGQTFTGYGENLLDYNRRTTRLRIGVALVR
ncbi:phospholipase A [Novosphingobium sp. P6W]|uniref:phospholipase A n=1 Tax=Novosphingobium sp. P6W TaxID=1609758 RepID=UPI0005C2D958|nr:phospholipase A [Novosphingobium sp. P6W]AXB78480.1 phospholipase [Novosphingobium sp. P6W]KIS32411.1 phospholipase A [Novosphingobium sp. P6W]